MSAATTSRRGPGVRRAGVTAVLLRRLPHDSAMHRLWAGTKFIALALLTVATLLNPSWAQLLAITVVVGLAVIVARVPRSAVPRLPIWFWLITLAGLGFAALGHGTAHYLQLICLSALFMILSAVLAWTTALDEIAPALRTLGAPLRRVGVPIDEWAITTALCVRSLPLLLDECRTLLAARRLRRQQPLRPGVALTSLLDLLTAAMAVTIRRAADMGDAITVRGGTRLAARPVRLSWRDAVALGVVVAACVVPSVVAV
jgi:energy-coupling factor transport system permease protein